MKYKISIIGLMVSLMVVAQKDPTWDTTAKPNGTKLFRQLKFHLLLMERFRKPIFMRQKVLKNR